MEVHINIWFWGWRRGGMNVKIKKIHGFTKSKLKQCPCFNLRTEMLHLKSCNSWKTTELWLGGWNAPAASSSQLADLSSRCLNRNKRINLNLESKQLTRLRSKPWTFADLYCHIWEGRNTDISGNRLDNRRKRRQPAPCTGTCWLEKETRAPAPESSPLAALPSPPAASEVWRRHGDLPCSRPADRHRQTEAAEGPHSSAAALDLEKLWEEKRERNYSQHQQSRAETRIKSVSCLLLTQLKQRLTGAARKELSRYLPQAADLYVLDDLIEFWESLRVSFAIVWFSGGRQRRRGGELWRVVFLVWELSPRIL